MAKYTRKEAARIAGTARWEGISARERSAVTREAAKAYWAGLSDTERSAEMKRRATAVGQSPEGEVNRGRRLHRWETPFRCSRCELKGETITYRGRRTTENTYIRRWTLRCGAQVIMGGTPNCHD